MIQDSQPNEINTLVCQTHSLLPPLVKRLISSENNTVMWNAFMPFFQYIQKCPTRMAAAIFFELQWLSTEKEGIINRIYYSNLT